MQNFKRTKGKFKQKCSDPHGRESSSKAEMVDTIWQKKVWMGTSVLMSDEQKFSADNITNINIIPTCTLIK